MQVSTVEKVPFSATQTLIKPAKQLNRSILKTSKNNLKNLQGPKEIKKAKAVVAATVAENIAIATAMAQAPGADEFVLGANEIKMAMEIYNGIYKFKFSKTVVNSLLTAIIGERIGTGLFKGATKFLTWIPGPGNAINGTVAGGTTAALGAGIIANAEEMDKARKNGEKLDKFIKAVDGYNKKNNKKGGGNG